MFCIWNLMTKGPALLSNENYVIYIDVQKGWPFYTLFNNFYRARYASTVLAVIVCPSVRLSVTSRIKDGKIQDHSKNVVR